MRPRIAVLMTFLGLGLAISSAAHGQGSPPATTETVEELRKELGELRDKAVQVPTLAAAVAELSSRLEVLERQIAAREREQAAIPDAIARLDQLDEEVRKLAREIEALETRLADAEQPSSPAVGAGGGVSHDGGFAWSTADQRYSIELAGYLQVRHQTRLSDFDVEEATFRLRRARVGLSGQLGSERVTYKLLLSALSSPALLDYYLDHAIRDGINVRVGQFKTHFTRAFITSSARIDFLELPRAVDGYRYDRDIQLAVHGTVSGGRLGYHLAVGNGAGPNARNDNLDVAVTLRADAVAVGERLPYSYGDAAREGRLSVMIGAGVVHDLVAMPADVGGFDGAINTDVDGDAERDNVRVVSASADAIMRYRGWEAVIEAVLRHESFGTILEHPDNAGLLAAVGERDRRLYWGASGQISTFLPRRIQVGARAAYSRQPFVGLGGRSSAIPASDRLWELDALVQLYDPHGYRLAGLMYSYHRFDDDAVDHDHRVILEAQIRL